MMEDLSAAYLENLTDFVGTLRARGFPVGIAETTDAALAIDLLGASDRARLKSALRALLAKSGVEQAIFNELFDEFFVPVKTRRRREADQARGQAEKERRMEEADRDLRFNGEPLDIRPDLKEVYVSLPEDEKNRLMQYLDTFADSIRRSPNLYRRFMQGLIEQQLMAEDAAAHAEMQAQQEDLLNKDIASFGEEDIPRAVRLLTALAKRIGEQLSASSRQRKRAAVGTIDFKRTIRRGLETGGVFVRLQYKKRNRRKGKLIVLCDVSASMVKFSEFAIRFIKSMSDASDRASVYLFSETLQEVDAFSLMNMDRFAAHVKESGLWGKGTDIGEAIGTLLSKQPPVLSRPVSLLIVSDAKTVDLPRAEAALKKAAGTVGHVFWLNPIPADKWSYSKSVTVLGQHCRMMSCSTLEELAQACAHSLLATAPRGSRQGPDSRAADSRGAYAD